MRITLHNNYFNNPCKKIWQFKLGTNHAYQPMLIISLFNFTFNIMNTNEEIICIGK